MRPFLTSSASNRHVSRVHIFRLIDLHLAFVNFAADIVLDVLDIEN